MSRLMPAFSQLRLHRLDDAQQPGSVVWMVLIVTPSG